MNHWIIVSEIQKNIIWVIYRIKQLRNYKKKNHGVLRGTQLGKQRWRARLGVLRVNVTLFIRANLMIISVYVLVTQVCEGCLWSIRPFWISREPVRWPWCNSSASQRSPYCASVNCHSPVGLVSRQWDAVDWACVLCDRRIHNDRASRSVSSRQCACPVYSLLAGFYFFLEGGQRITSPSSLSPPYSPYLALFDFWLFPELKSPLKRKRFVKATVYNTQAQSTASHCRLTSPMGQWLFTDAQ